jgi:hypothetical protein
MNHVQTAVSPSTLGVTSSTITLAGAVAAGDLLVATVNTRDSSGTAPTVHDGSGHSFTVVRGFTNTPGGDAGGDASVWVLYLVAPTSSGAGTLSITGTTPSLSIGLVVDHYSVASGATVSVLTTASGTGGATPVTGGFNVSLGPLTWTAGLSALVYGAVATSEYPEGTSSPGPGFTSTYDTQVGPGSPGPPGLHTSYQANTTTGSDTLRITIQNGTYVSMVAVVFAAEQSGQLYLGGPAQAVAGVVSGPCAVRLGAPAPSNVVVSLSSSDPSDTFSLTPGGSTITTVTIPTGSAQATFRVNLSSTSGTHNISVSATGYTANGSPLAISAATPTSGSLHFARQTRLEFASGPAYTFLGGSAWGIAWRFRADTATGGSNVTVLDWATGYSSTPLMVWHPSSQTATITLYSGGTPTAWSVTLPLLIGIDYTFAITGGTTPTLYVDGVAYATAPWSGAAYAYQGLELCGDGGSGVTLDHRLSDVALWGSYSPTAAEVLAWTEGSTLPVQFATPADAWWTLGGTSGATASLSDPGFLDLAGGGNTWTVAKGSISSLAYGGAITVGNPTLLAPLVTKSGKLAIFGTCVNQAASNGGYPLATIAAAPASSPTISVNGNAVSIGPAVGSFSAKDTAFVAYLLRCGGVERIGVSDGGEGYSGTVTATWNGDGGGTGLVVANPTTANGGIRAGVTSYTVVNGGSWGSAPSVSVAPPLTYNQPGGGSAPVCTGTLSGSALASVANTAGGVLGCGAGYTVGSYPTVSVGTGSGMALTATVVGGVITGITCTNGGANYPPTVQVNFWDATGSGAIATIVTGSGAFYYVGSLTGGTGYTNPAMTLVPVGNSTVVRANVNDYIAEIPVTRPGSGFTSPPTFTISQRGASATRAAVPVAIMAGVSPGDTVEYSASGGWLDPTMGGSPLGGIRPVANAMMANFSGQREGTRGGFGCFAQAPTMLAGANIGEQPVTPYSVAFTGKNKYKQGVAWTSPGGSVTTASDGTLISWTGATAAKWIYGPLSPNAIDDMGMAGYTGQWTLRYDDPYVGGAGATAAALNGGSTATLLSTSVSGTTVTKIYDIEFSDTTSTWEPNVGLAISNSSGTMTISNIWVVAPDAITKLASPIDPTRPLASDDSFVRAVTTPDGKAIGCLRFMDATQSYAGSSGFVWPSDLLDVNADSWGTGSSIYVTFPYARFYNTNPGSTTYAWHSPKIYGGQCWFTQSDTPFTITGTLTSGSAVVTNLSSNALMVGSTVTGAGVPATDGNGEATIIASIPQPGTTFLLSAPATASGPTTLTVTNPNYITLPASNNGQFMATDSNSYQSGVVEFRSTTPHGFSSGRNVTVYVGATSNGSPSVGINFTGTSGPFLATILNGGFGWVTGPYTIAVPLDIASVVTGTPGQYIQTVNSTSEIDLTAGGTVDGWLVFVKIPQNFACMPYEYAAACAAEVGSGYWLNIPAGATDALIRTIVRKTAAYIGATVPVYLEFSNEIWNGAFGDHALWYLLANLWGNTSIYPSGSHVATYYPAGTTPTGFVYSTAATLGAHHYDVFTAEWTALGLDASRIKRVMGSWYSGTSTTVGICSTAASFGFNFDHIAVGPYLDTTNDATLVQACTPPGMATGAGYWPVDAINDYFRHQMAYGGDGNNPGYTNQSFWRGHVQACLDSGLSPPPTMVCYEGAPETAVPYGTPFQVQLLHDCFAHPSFRDVQWGWYAACQLGDQTLSGGGAVVANDYQLYNNVGYASMWAMGYGPAQPPGDGLLYAYDATGSHSWPANQFATIQGGLPADNRDHNGGTPGNTSPALQGLRDWFEVSSPLPAQPTKPGRPRRWFSGLGQATSLRLAR